MKAGFIGGGKMAEAIIAAVLKSKLLESHEVFASDNDVKRRSLLKSRYGINAYSKNKIVASSAETLFLCVKPQELDEVLIEIAGDVTREQLIISIAAGKKLSSVEAKLPASRVIRVMPNLPALVSSGMSVYCTGTKVKSDDKRTASKFFSCFGRVLELPEDHFDTVTALSGSGPAFFAYFLKIMVEAGVAQGLDRKDALVMAEQTMLGTSKLIVEQSIDPADLIRDVSSAKGTTVAGLKVLEKSDIADVIRRMIAAAAKRSKELSVG